MDLLCEKCWYNSYDDEAGESYCSLSLDEDEYIKLMQDFKNGCKYFRADGGEYEIVRRQN